MENYQSNYDSTVLTIVLVIVKRFNTRPLCISIRSLDRSVDCKTGYERKGLGIIECPRSIINQFRNFHIGTNLESTASVSDMHTFCCQSTPFTLTSTDQKTKTKLIKSIMKNIFC